MKQLLLLSLIILTACQGYKTGDLKHPEIDSIAIAKVVNQTNRPELSKHIQQNLRARVQTDGTYILADSTTADCVVQTFVKDYRTVGRGSFYRSSNKDDNDNEDYGSALYEFIIDVEFVITVPGRNRPLVQLTKATGSGRFTNAGDIEMNRQNAIKKAATEVAVEVISGLTEAW